MVKKITDYLRKKYDAEAIILHGSRATKNNRPNSDWDLFIFTKEQPKPVDEGGSIEEYLDQQLDAKVVHLPLDRHSFLDEFAYVLYEGEVLLDNEDEFAKGLILDSKELYEAGKTLSVQQFLNRKNYMARTIDRLEGTVERPELFFLYMGYFYEKALNYWYEIKGKHSKPAYKAIEEIRKVDPAYYDLLSILFSTTFENPQRLTAAKKIHNILFLQSL